MLLEFMLLWWDMMLCSLLDKYHRFGGTWLPSTSVYFCTEDGDRRFLQNANHQSTWPHIPEHDLSSSCCVNIKFHIHVALIASNLIYIYKQF
jgi:hypothetical protein